LSERSRVIYLFIYFVVAGQSKQELERLNFHLTLISYAGHYHLRLPDFPLRLANLRFSKKSLAFADVTGFLNLQVLDLSHNELTEVRGLERLQALRQLNLFGNPQLNPVTVLQALKNVNSLWEVWLASSKAMVSIQKYCV
jgi:Leucine-rich repeat (LRR) protein